MGLLVFFFILSISFSFLCSILEAVLLSINPSFVTQKVNEGSQTGKLLQEYKKDIDRPLSAILTLNTIAHTVGAIGVGALAGDAIGTGPIEYGDGQTLPFSWESLVATVMTLAILILSEIIPKTIGANNWKSLTPFTMYTLRIIMFLLAPFVWISQLITKSLKKDKSKSVLSRADFAAMTQVGESSGALNKDESEIIKNVLNFETQNVRSIMTPKTVAFMVSENMTIQEFLASEGAKTYSRVPLYSNDKDNIIGFVLKDEVLSDYVNNKDGAKKLSDLKRTVNSVSQKTALPELFKKLSEDKQHLSVVKDEFGAVVGLVTLEDLFETLLGREIVDESDKIADLQEFARKKYEESK